MLAVAIRQHTFQINGLTWVKCSPFLDLLLEGAIPSAVSLRVSLDVLSD